MIGVWRSRAGVYLQVVAVGMLVVAGIPLLLAPLWWTRLLGWPTPRPDEVVAFLGRSLGAMICVLSGAALKAARAPTVQPFFFDLVLWTFFVMLIIHVHGAIRGTQPVSETVEIGLWAVLMLVTLGFHPRRADVDE